MRTGAMGVALAATVLACAGDERDGMDATTLTSGGPGSSGGTGGVDTGGGSFDVPPGGDTGATGGDQGNCQCGANLEFIYVLSSNQELWYYAPETNDFTMVGPLGCPSTDTTFSMGVGRNGTAWVQTTAVDLGTLNSIGDLFKIKVANPGDCTDPGYTPGSGGWQQFGMAFVSRSAADPCDDLFGAHWNGVGGTWTEEPGAGRLGKFDQASLVMNTIGAIDFNGAELTGTGDGRVYAFGGVPDAKLVQFSKQDASVVETIPFAGFPTTNAFAFGFWGGDFYFFTNSDPNGLTLTGNSKVTHLDYDDSNGAGQVLTEVNAMAPMLIVGAGVSTCAPFRPPG